ncbi:MULTISPECIES: 2-dehydro-3-deoxygalactonokinase [Sporosarcina]|uniref:2-dehydro-3-deoxygalactonokinase n=1 Tax=Sporosarcina newyorkensis TaxID=759851 RepID=A0A1T4Y289_9BACL|nr:MULTISPECIES: 2-dehydro-3-deoxygalactonokinase [Sporosarcina]MBY0223477.1 2-dehydro-3-deoxygalactonokinase [Sporosarcina aquimarina]SKA95743.1 2-dehydro-3-deoxygalactonokinase [Sporosarcina newyorkensis]
MFTILIDSGTTNSRIRLIESSKNLITDIEKVRIGVRNTAIEGTNEGLKNHLHNGIANLLERNNLSAANIEYIVASGMITSKLGILEVPHLTAPVTAEDFAKNSQVAILDEFFNIPCIFVPGMSNYAANVADQVDQINQFDVMRGEEVESLGLLKQLELEGRGILVLPGSHTKFVMVDRNRTLSSCLSTLAGETLMAIQKETILSDSVSSKLVQSVDESMLLKGFRAAETHGLTRSFYHVRLLELFTDVTDNERANYYAGAVIHEDLKSLLSSVHDSKDIEWVVVGGSNPLRSLFTILLKHLGPKWNVIEASDLQVEYSLVLGAQEVAERIDQNLFKNCKKHI